MTPITSRQQRQKGATKYLQDQQITSARTPTMTPEQVSILRRKIMQTVENELYDRILFDAPDDWSEAVLEEIERAVLTPIHRSVENLTADELKHRNTAKAHVQAAAIL